MFEIALGVTICVVMARIAYADGKSPFVWSGITLLLCLASLLIPVPYLRMMAAGFVVLAAMFVWNLANPPR